MAIEQFGKITYNDINNLNNESITTKNIYASGTSADIGTADNPFDKVYANYYYGTKYSTTQLFRKAISSLTTGSCFPLEKQMSDFEFIAICTTGFSNLTLLPVDWVLSVHANIYGGYRYTINETGTLIFYISTSSNFHVLSFVSNNLTSNYFYILGYR